MTANKETLAAMANLHQQLGWVASTS